MIEINNDMVQTAILGVIAVVTSVVIPYLRKMERRMIRIEVKLGENGDCRLTALEERLTEIQIDLAILRKQREADDAKSSGIG